jgi:hypothetical protein
MKAYNQQNKQMSGINPGEHRESKYEMGNESKGKNGSNTTSRNENTFGVPN